MDVYNIAIAVFVSVLVSENVLCAMLKQESEGSGILGIDATQKILVGAKKLRSQKRYRNHEKLGDLDTALKDFLSINPTGLTEFTKFRRNGKDVKVLSGNVGDRKIHLINYTVLGERHNPVIEIVDVNEAKRLRLLDGIEGGQYADKIVYKKHIKGIK